MRQFAQMSPRPINQMRTSATCGCSARPSTMMRRTVLSERSREAAIRICWSASFCISAFGSVALRSFQVEVRPCISEVAILRFAEDIKYGSLHPACGQWLFQQSLKVPLAHPRGSFLEHLHVKFKREQLKVGITQSGEKSVCHRGEPVSVEAQGQRRECFGK